MSVRRESVTASGARRVRGLAHWLSHTLRNNRTWSNFKQKLKILCSRHVDVANILFDVMCSNSDKYSTYAEYTRRSLLCSFRLFVSKTRHRSNTPNGANNTKRSYQNLPSTNTGSNSEGSISRKRRIKDSAIRCYTCG